jgi:hypothetical protein
MKEIELTQGKVALVDDEDYGWLNQWKWFADKNKNTFYARRQGKTNNGKQSAIRMHRLILNATNKETEVDHYDMNGLNNQRYNIRLCTGQQNRMNQKSRQGTSSKFKGVAWNKARKKWHARIGFNGEKKHLGLFISETEAALAYNKAATELFGEFARLNIIEELRGI